MENINIFTRIYDELSLVLNKAISEEIFPGAVMGITLFSDAVKESCFFSFGCIEYSGRAIKKKIFFDLASLTKPLATSLAVMSLLKNKKISLDDSLADLVEIDMPINKKSIKLKHLLNHCSGLPAYKPYFQELAAMDEGSKNIFLVKKILAEEPVYKTGSRQLYSDLGFMLIGEIIEKRAGCRLDEYVRQKIYKPMELDNMLFFNYGNTKRKGVEYAPTEECGWRKKLLCGQVHDDNAYAVGGVAGQAGLFGNIYGLVGIINYLVDIIGGRKKHPNINKNDLINFTKKQNDKGTFGLGFDTPSQENSSSGRFFSKKSFGHLGFTGTSFWVDLQIDISIALLTNRVNPDRNNNKIKDFRPRFHDTIMRLAGKGL